MDFIAWLNDNAGVLTFAFIVMTFLTLMEMRATRIATALTAHVAFRPDIDRETGQTLKLRLRNHGPAIAEEVRTSMQWFAADEARGAKREMTEPLLGVGDERVFHPAMLLRASAAEQTPSLAKMDGLSLRVEWSWLDDRRYVLAPWVHRRAERRYDLHAAGFASSMHGGPLVIERTGMPDALAEVRDELRKMNDRAMIDDLKRHRPQDAEGAAISEHAILTARWRREKDLWRARWRVWTRRK